MCKIMHWGGYPRAYVSEREDARIKTLANWIKRYNESGEAGLKDKPRSKAQIHSEVKEQIVEIKKEYLIFGSRKISDILKRIFFLNDSPVVGSTAVQAHQWSKLYLLSLLEVDTAS